MLQGFQEYTWLRLQKPVFQKMGTHVLYAYQNNTDFVANWKGHGSIKRKKKRPPVLYSSVP